jgi:hypothetical protein
MVVVSACCVASCINLLILEIDARPLCTHYFNICYKLNIIHLSNSCSSSISLNILVGAKYIIRNPSLSKVCHSSYEPTNKSLIQVSP